MMCMQGAEFIVRNAVLGLPCSKGGSPDTLRSVEEGRSVGVEGVLSGKFPCPGNVDYIGFAR